mmetsp:Transcript_356/g.610  ORF Transcript_356/g.610 Transcript_356/m.610 type:complete len:98 (+) Transcript_356:519-812(+)
MFLRKGCCTLVGWKVGRASSLDGMERGRVDNAHHDLIVMGKQPGNLVTIGKTRTGIVCSDEGESRLHVESTGLYVFIWTRVNLEWFMSGQRGVSFRN